MKTEKSHRHVDTQTEYRAAGLLLLGQSQKPQNDLEVRQSGQNVGQIMASQRYLRISQGFPSGSAVKNSSARRDAQKLQVQSLGQEDTLEEEMTTHPSILAWKTPWTDEPCLLYRPQDCEELGTNKHVYKHTHRCQQWCRICQCRRHRRHNPGVGKIPWRKEWQLTSVLLLGNP